MLVKLKYMDESVESFEVEDRLTIGELKRKNSRTPAAEQKYVFRGRVLQNEKTLRHYQVSDGDVVHCVVIGPTAEEQRSSVTNRRPVLNPARLFHPVQGSGNWEVSSSRNHSNSTATFGGSPSVGVGFGRSSSHQHADSRSDLSTSSTSTSSRPTTPSAAWSDTSSPREQGGCILYHVINLDADDDSESDDTVVLSDTDEDEEVYVNRFPLISLFFPGILGESETSDDASSNNSNLNRRILAARRRLPQNRESASQQPTGFSLQSSQRNGGNGVQTESFQPAARGSYPNRRILSARRRLPHNQGNASQQDSLFQPQSFQPTGFAPRVQSGGPNRRFFTCQQLPQNERSSSQQANGFQPQSSPCNDDQSESFLPRGFTPRFQSARPSGLFGFQPQGNVPMITPQPQCSFSFQPRPSLVQPSSGVPAQGNSYADIFGFQLRNQSTPTQVGNPPRVVEQNRSEAVTVTYIDSAGQTREISLSQARELASLHLQSTQREDPPVIENTRPEGSGVTVTYTDNAGQTREISLSQARELAGGQVNAREYPVLPDTHQDLITDSDDSG